MLRNDKVLCSFDDVKRKLMYIQFCQQLAFTTVDELKPLLFTFVQEDKLSLCGFYASKIDAHKLNYYLFTFLCLNRFKFDEAKSSSSKSFLIYWRRKISYPVENYEKTLFYELLHFRKLQNSNFNFRNRFADSDRTTGTSVF